MDSFDAFVGRGGLLKPIESGTYQVDEAICADLKSGQYGKHASNLGGLIAYELAKSTGKAAYIADPVVVDEFDDLARISGIPEYQPKKPFPRPEPESRCKKIRQGQRGKIRRSRPGCLSHGGGVSIGAHHRGRVIDVNNALDGDGPFSPERAGGVPAGQLVAMCFSGEYSQAEIKKKLTGKGGLVAYLGTNDAKSVEDRAAAGDEEAKLIFDAMAYQISKEIGAAATVLKGHVDAVILTGGIAYSKYMVASIKERVGFIADVTVYPGEEELLALAEASLRVMNGEEEAKKY
jgi:butyrate kinase